MKNTPYNKTYYARIIPVAGMILAYSFGEISIKEFNVRMAKQKTGKSNTKSKKTKIRHLGLKLLFGIPAVLVLLLLSFEVYKEVATRQDIKLLDQAEAKMRQLESASSSTATFSRSCSEKSVKFGSPGKPSCRIHLSINYSNNKDNALLRAELSDLGYETKLSAKSDTRSYYELKNFIPSLDCTVGELFDEPGQDLANESSAVMYCQKKFWKKAYPIN